MGTDIAYNGILFKDVLTRDINQEIVYDSTGLNPIYVRVVVEADVTIIGGVSTTTIGFAQNRPIAVVMSHVLTKILEPRRPFAMTVDDIALFDVNAAEQTNIRAGEGELLTRFDVNNGPKATINVRHIIGTNSVRATFRVELAIPNCPDKKVGNGLISLRYWTNDDVDENWYTTRTFHGRLRVASKGFNPNSFDNIIFPPIGAGFKRVSISTQEDPNGLELEFTVVDKEFSVSCPFPATTWRGTHNVSTPFVGGIIGDSEVRVELEGPKSTSKTDLVTLAVNIIDSKLQLNLFALASVEGKGLAMLMYYAISESLERNRVTATARIRHSNARTGTGNIFSETVGQPPRDIPDYTPNVSRGFVPTALSAEVKQRLGSSCYIDIPFQSGGGSSAAKKSPDPSASDSKPGSDISTEQSVGELTDYETFYSDNQSIAMYSYYSLSTQYEVEQGVVGLPVGTSSSSSINSREYVQLHKPTGDMTVRVVAERINIPPEIPRPKASYVKNGITHTLLHWDVTPAAAAFTGDGRTQVFHVEAQLKYGLNRAPNLATDKLQIGQNPALSRNSVDTELPTAMFTNDQYGT